MEIFPKLFGTETEKTILKASEKEKETGFTPLQLAAKGGHLKISEVLLAKGAEVNAKGSDDKTPLILANRNDHKDIVKLLQR